MGLAQYLMENYDKLFVTADQHWGHTNILRLDATRTPLFKDINDMDTKLIEYWNQVVGPEDVVLHLGDIALTSKRRMSAVFSQLNGSIVLLIGNHDACRTRTFWRSHGFMYVTDKPITLGDVIFTHIPLVPEVNPGRLRNIHGHMHSRGGKDCVSVELTEFRPVKLSEMV